MTGDFFCSRPDIVASMVRRLMLAHNPHKWTLAESVRAKTPRDIKLVLLEGMRVYRTSRVPVVFPLNFDNQHAAFAVYDPRGPKPKLYAFDQAFCTKSDLNVRWARHFYRPLATVSMNDPSSAPMTRLGRSYDQGYAPNVIPKVHASLGCTNTCVFVSLAVLREMMQTDTPDPKAAFASLSPDRLAAEITNLRARYLASAMI